MVGRVGICLAVLILFWTLPAAAQSTVKACIKAQCYTAQVAREAAARQTGLSEHTVLDFDAGMLFVFPQSARHGFWMKNMHFPIDILWLNAEKRIVHIEHYVPPCLTDDRCPVYKPAKPARFVLELNAGEVIRHGFREGDIVTVTDQPQQYFMLGGF